MSTRHRYPVSPCCSCSRNVVLTLWHTPQHHLHLPHAAIGFAVAWVDANSTFAVLHSPHVVPQLAVGCSSGETGQSADTLALLTEDRGLSRRWSVAGRWVGMIPHSTGATEAPEPTTDLDRDTWLRVTLYHITEKTK